MRILALLFIFILSLVAKELDVNEVDSSQYVIQVSSVKTYASTSKTIKRLDGYNTYVAKVKSYFVVYIVNLQSRDVAQKTLVEIHKMYKDAYVKKLKNIQKNVIEDTKVTKEFMTSDKIQKPSKNAKYEPESKSIKIDKVEEEKAVEAPAVVEEEIDKVEEEKAVEAPAPIIESVPDSKIVIQDENLSTLNELKNLKLQIDDNDTKEEEKLEDDDIFKADRDEGFSLLEAIVHSLNQNYKLKASNQRVVQSKQRVTESEAGHLPVVEISGNTGYEGRTSEPGDILDANSTVGDQKYNYQKAELYLSITENLWSGGKIEGSINQQENKLQASLFDHRDKIEAATLEIIQAYFDVVYGEISVKISKHNMQSYQTILEIVKTKEENGASTKGDVNFILANVKNAKTSLVNTQAKLSDAMAKYVYLMQDVDKTNMPYETDVDTYVLDLNKSIDHMHENNAKLLKQKANIKASNYAIDVQTAAYYPSVDFAVNAETRDEFNTGIGRRQKVNALVSFKYNLYRGGKDEAAYMRTLAKLSEQKYTLTDMNRKFEFDIKVIHRSVSSIEESLELTRSEVMAARKVVDSYWIAFKHGTQDLQALQLAQRNLNRAQLDYVNYKKSLIINDFKLMKNTGEILKFLKLDTSAL